MFLRRRIQEIIRRKRFAVTETRDYTIRRVAVHGKPTNLFFQIWPHGIQFCVGRWNESGMPRESFSTGFARENMTDNELCRIIDFWLSLYFHGTSASSIAELNRTVIDAWDKNLNWNLAVLVRNNDLEMRYLGLFLQKNWKFCKGGINLEAYEVQESWSKFLRKCVSPDRIVHLKNKDIFLQQALEYDGLRERW